MPATLRGRASSSVDTPCPAYYQVCDDWELADDLLGQTPAMHAAGQRWLPRYPKENPTVWAQRLSNTNLYPGFGRQVSRLSIKPFAKDVTINGDEQLTPELGAIAANVDGAGATLTQFSRTVLRDGVARGVGAILVDHPTVDSRVSPVERQQARIRPTFRRIHPRDLIYWDWAVGDDGMRRLSEVRIHEVRTERVGDYGLQEWSYIRVIRAPTTVTREVDGQPVVERQAGEWELHRKRTPLASDPVKRREAFRQFGRGDYDEIDSGTHTYPGVPVVLALFGVDDEGRPRMPLLDTAYANLRHYRSSSRQAQYLEAIRVAVLFGAGFSKDEIKKGITIAPNAVTAVTNVEAKLAWVEHTGAAAQTGWDDLDRLQEEMESTGSEPLRQRSGNVTATGKAIEAGKINTDIEVWVRLLESMIEQAYEIAAIYIGQTLPDDFAVDVWTDFAIALSRHEDVQVLLEMRKNRDLSRERLLTEVRRRGLVSDDMDIEAEIQAIEDELAAEMRALPNLSAEQGDLEEPDNPRTGAPDQNGVPVAAT